jgi:hypothetical protein
LLHPRCRAIACNYFLQPSNKKRAAATPFSFYQPGQSDNTHVHSASGEQQLIAACHLFSIYSYRRALNNNHSHPFSPKSASSSLLSFPFHFARLSTSTATSSFIVPHKSTSY